MTVESAVDLASFFETEEFAEPALYTPPGGGEPVSCTVIVDRGQARTHFDAGERPVASKERVLRVQDVEVRPRRGGSFAMLDADGEPTGEVIEVAGEPSLDETGQVWSTELVIRG